MGRRREDEEDFDYLEEEGHHSIAMIIGGIVLLVIIIVLCIMIWQLSHKDKTDQGAVQQSKEDTLVSDNILGEPKESGEDDPLSPDGQENEGQNGASSGSDQQTGQPAQESSQQSGNAVTMTFRDVDETVTAKELTNLRSEPSTARDDTVVVQLKNGQTAKRTGINTEAGWSRLEYDGQVLYAANSLLTTDLTVKSNASDGQSSQNGQSGSGGQGSAGQQSGSGQQSSPGQQAESGSDSSENQASGASASGNTVTTSSGRTITFTPCDDTISPKIEANLRGEPSTDQENASVHHRLAYGETAHRTGYDEDSGWSRVEYNGEVLYVVTSLIYVVEEPAE